MSRYVRGYYVYNGEIFESDLDVDWDTLVAQIKKCALHYHDGAIATGRQWAVLIDTAMHIARQQVERTIKSLDHDPIMQASWQPYYDAVRSGNPNIHRMGR